jgi:xyloglucan-specific exo-beta-1,4-glucanase
MFGLAACAALAFAALQVVQGAPSAQTYKWKSVKIGGGGGFVPGKCRFWVLGYGEVLRFHTGIVFNTKEKGLAYARTDIGGLYKLNADDTWTPLLDFADSTTWNYWGVDAVGEPPPFYFENLY